MEVKNDAAAEIEKDFSRELAAFIKSSNGFGRFHYIVNFSNGKRTNTKVLAEKSKK